MLGVLGMTRLVAALALVVALVATTSTASADCGVDCGESYDGLAVLVLGDIVLPPLLLVGDGLVRPTSKAYGVFEIAVGGATGLLNLSVASDTSDGGVFYAFTAIDLAVAAHGAYLVLHEDETGKQISVAPKMVSDGKAMAPGLAIAGAW